MSAEYKRILVLCKTYPSPSSRHIETSCVAGMDETGKLIRLFPVPFRLVTDEQQFKKWQWIRARVRKAPDDHRLESHRISVDTIETLGDPLSTKSEWIERRNAISDLEIFPDFDSLESARTSRNISLGLIKPNRLIDVRIEKARSPDWTSDEITKLMRAQNQGSLFDEDAEQKSLKLLRKIPYDFYYRYECLIQGDLKIYEHKIVDWEAGALYWNIHRRPGWQCAFRQKYLIDFAERDTMLLMGNIHRFQDQWLIISVLYPPKPRDSQSNQADLF